MGARRRWLTGRAPDLLLVLGVLGFAALLALFVGRGSRAPSVVPGVAPLAQRDPQAGRPLADAPAEAPGATAPPQDQRSSPSAPDPPGSGRPPGAFAGSTGESGAPDAGAGDEPGVLRISGRVLDRAGQPVPDIRIDLRPLRVQGPGNAVRSQDDGHFEIAGLAAGDYRLSTGETTIYRSHGVVVRGGSEGVDIILDQRQALRVHGRVTGAQDEPLAGARVEPLSNPGAGVSTDEDGRYQLIFEASLSPRSAALRFSADGHRDLQQRIALAGLPPEGLEEDVQLEAIRGFAVTGRVRAPGSQTPPISRVQLRSQRLAIYRKATTDVQGRFRIEDVEAGDDWTLIVHPGGGFADASLGPLLLDGSGGELEITLDPLAGGSVEGRMLRPDGRPLPGFRVHIHSRSAVGRTVSVVGDDQGRFLAEGVPPGDLQFQTRGTPSHRVTGLRLEPGARERVDLVLDEGDLDLAGRILGSDGRPLAGAEIRLTWRREADGTASTSFRRTVSDTEGAFRFRQLGRDPHQIDARAEGHARVRQQVSPGSRKLELRLAAEP